MKFDYFLFEKSAIQALISTTEFQSIEYPLGKKFIDIISGELLSDQEFGPLLIDYLKDNRGILFIGPECSKTFFLFDLTQCNIMSEQKFPETLLYILQKTFRTAVRVWMHQPFTSSERINGSKSIVFPLGYGDPRRVVFERSVNIDRLSKRGFSQLLLAYKYGSNDAPTGIEVVKFEVMKTAGDYYNDCIQKFTQFFKSKKSMQKSDSSNQPLHLQHTVKSLEGKGFKYAPYDLQLNSLTEPQKKIVCEEDLISPIRIDGPAGTGKSTALILRAYYLLLTSKSTNTSQKIIVFTHNESTKHQLKETFKLLEYGGSFLDENSQQNIRITTLYSYAIEKINIRDSEILEKDLGDAKIHQTLLIEEALDRVYKKLYQTYKTLLSPKLSEILDNNKTPKVVLLSLLNHEFGVQIKGRTKGNIDEYKALDSIPNGLPVSGAKDKEFVFSIFKEYQNMLEQANTYDSDDIILQALSYWNAPFWRRERKDGGFDYIIIDEMHLFNINEQQAFHFLTKDPEQKKIPICFALDYSQAIGDRGDRSLDYTETLSPLVNSTFKTVFRSLPQITDLCVSISASGAMMFSHDYKNPYSVPTSGFLMEDEKLSEIPKMYMYTDLEDMFAKLTRIIADYKKTMSCKNKDILIISFNGDYLQPDFVKQMSDAGIPIQKISDPSVNRNSDYISYASPYDINGLEYKGVILIEVDGEHVPQKSGVSDVSSNYLRYIAYNQLYLSCSRAKYRVTILGNKLHGESVCLLYSLEHGTLERG